MLDVVVAEHVAAGREDPEAVRLGLAGADRLALGDEPVAVLLEREATEIRRAVRRCRDVLVGNGARLDVERPARDERSEEGAGEAGDEERDASHAAS